MSRRNRIHVFGFLAALVAFGAGGAWLARTQDGLALEKHTSGKFSGVKVKSGTVTHTFENGKHVLTLSEDFKSPDTPDPHWQIVDTSGTTYLLARCMVKGDKLNRSIQVPAYVPDVAKVQIWCAFAESNLGEASFAAPIAIAAKSASTKTAKAESK